MELLNQRNPSMKKQQEKIRTLLTEANALGILLKKYGGQRFEYEGTEEPLVLEQLGKFFCQKVVAVSEVLEEFFDQLENKSGKGAK